MGTLRNIYIIPGTGGENCAALGLLALPRAHGQFAPSARGYTYRTAWLARNVYTYKEWQLEVRATGLHRVKLFKRPLLVDERRQKSSLNLATSPRWFFWRPSLSASDDAGNAYHAGPSVSAVC